ncbi:MAG: hypothetical protein ABJH28_03735 [Paraglaciecola sp.]|uniref:hypothetical protein n=1 Tax=Paraglaciecola sp. TaxID=1920173 RepID=UPI00326477AE
MFKRIKLHLFLLFFIFTSLFTYAQYLDSKGTEFWLAFPESSTNLASPELSFFISSSEDAEIIVEIPGLAFTDSVMIAANIATKYTLPSGLETLEFDTAQQTGIKLSSVVEFSAYGLSRYPESTDAYLGLPTDVIGTDYAVLAWDTGVVGASEYLIVATEDNTTIDITASHLDTISADTQITLNAGETYQHSSQENGDVTGTVISADYPIAVFAGHQCANIPDLSTLACDHILEQLPPTNSWGSQFFTVPLAERLSGDTFRFFANLDNTEITINDELVATINSGEYFETILLDATYVTSSNPILVSQYSNGSTFDDVTSDPFMMLIPPFEQFLDEYTFSTPTEGFRANYLNIVVRTDSISALSLDLTMLDPSYFTQIFSSEYSYVQIDVELGSHTLTGAVAGVYAYGYDSYDSYGYSGGLSLSSVASVASIELFEDYEIVDDLACFSVLVSDVDELPLEDIRVDFLIDLLNGSDRTDTQGVAEYCIEAGTNPGEYVVTATVGNETVSDTIEQTIVEEVIEEEVVEEVIDLTGDTVTSKGGGGAFGIIGILGVFSLFCRVRRKKLHFHYS